MKLSNKKSKRNFILLAVLLILIVSFVFVLKKDKSKITKIGYAEFELTLAGEPLNTTNILSTNKPNKPQLGAGMIPIKWNGTSWQITTTEDNGWYDYSNGKMATVMLSDGKYVSELREDMTDKIIVPEDGNLPEIASED